MKLLWVKPWTFLKGKFCVWQLDFHLDQQNENGHCLFSSEHHTMLSTDVCLRCSSLSNYGAILHLLSRTSMLQDPHWVSELSPEYRTSTKILHVLISFLLEPYELTQVINRSLYCYEAFQQRSSKLQNSKTPYRTNWPSHWLFRSILKT